MRSTEGHGLADGGVLLEHVVDLARRDLLAAAVDHLLEPADQREIAAGVDHPLVAGAKPTVNERRCVGFWVVRVAVDDVGALDHDFPGVRAAVLENGAVVGHDTQAHPRSDADTSRPARRWREWI